MSSWPYTRLPPEGRFEIYKDSAGKFRFRLKAANNEIVVASEAYESKSGCKKGIQSVKENAAKAEIVDMTKEDTSS